jgi:hypothetical protein
MNGIGFSGEHVTSAGASDHAVVDVNVISFYSSYTLRDKLVCKMFLSRAFKH